MQNVTNCDDKIKAVLQSIADTDLSSTARLVAVLEAFGITDRAEVERLTASKPSTIREARRTLEIQRQKSSGDGNPAPEIQRTAGNPAQAPEIQRQKSSALVCADITTRVNKESSSKILVPSEVKEVSEVGAFSQNAKTPTDVSQDVVSRKTKAADRGSRLQNDFVVPSDWIDWTRTNCPGSTPETAAVEALKFTNYWTSLAGAKARKTDWLKTWQNWSMTAFSRAPLRPTATAGTGNAPWVDEKIKRQRDTMKWAKEAGLI